MILSCGDTKRDDVKDDSPSVVGIWNGGNGVYYILNGDNTGVIKDNIEGEDIVWRLEGSKLIITTMLGDTISYRIKFQTDRTMILDNTFKFRKIVKNNRLQFNI